MITTLSMAELMNKTEYELDALFLQAVEILESTRPDSLEYHMALHLIETIVYVLFYKIKGLKENNHNLGFNF